MSSYVHYGGKRSTTPPPPAAVLQSVARTINAAAHMKLKRYLTSCLSWEDVF